MAGVAVLVSVALQVAVVYVPFLQRAFSTAPLDARDWVVCVVVASSVLWAMELKKLVSRPRYLRPSSSSATNSGATATRRGNARG